MMVGYHTLAVGQVAKDDAARKFCEKFDFIPSPTDPMRLFILLKDIRQLG